MQSSIAFDVQIMSVGGNGRARQFFKQHGWSELGADKIEQKVSMQGWLCSLLASLLMCYTSGKISMDQQPQTAFGHAMKMFPRELLGQPCPAAADAESLFCRSAGCSIGISKLLATLLPAVYLPGSAEVQAAAREGCGKAVGAAQARGPG